MYGTKAYGTIEYGGRGGVSNVQEEHQRIYQATPDKFKWKRGMFMAKADKFKKKLLN